MGHQLSWSKGLGEGISRPGLIGRKAWLLAINPIFRRLRLKWLSTLTDIPAKEVKRYIIEIEHDREFLNHVRRRYRQYTRYLPLPTDFTVHPSGSTMFFHCVSMYTLVRLLRPEYVIETGGTPGKSSAFLLRALERNGHGHLYTIDLPPQVTDLPVSPSEAHTFLPYHLSANWGVPETLRSNQTLLLGPAEKHLLTLLSKLGHIDIFLHDSDHSYSQMIFELQLAYPFVRSGGYLWADDIGTNSAWYDFCAEHALARQDFTSQGVARKL